MGRIFEKRKETIFKTAAQKSKLYSKYGRQLYMAAKNGVPDPEANSALRSVIERAKRLGFLLPWNHLSAAVGVIVTGIAISFGSSFWFALLKRLVGMRNSS